MKLEIIHSRSPKFDGVRNFIASVYSKRYTGWDSEFDRQFDDQTVCFFVEENSEIVASARLIFRRDNGRDKLSPHFSVNSNWKFEDHNIECEGTGLCYRMGYLQPLMLGMFSWLDYQEIGNSMSLFDLQNTRVRNYQKHVLEFHPIVDATVTFANFYRSNPVTGEVESDPVNWGVGIQTKEARKKAVVNLKGALLNNEHFFVEPPR